MSIYHWIELGVQEINSRLQDFPSAMQELNANVKKGFQFYVESCL